jgi:hypothetical protein
MAHLSTRTAGTALAFVGASHFVTPGLYEPATTLAFPTNTRDWVYRNGATEVVLGLTLRSRRTQLRRLSVAGIAGYLLWLGVNTVKSR